MMETDLAQIRFGYGFGPQTQRATRAQMLEGLAGPDRAVQRHPVAGLRDAMALAQAFRRAAQAAQAGEQGAEARYETTRDDLRALARGAVQASFARILDGRAPLRERLTWFWADHFTAIPADPVTRAASGAYIDEAIRPHLTALFADMLRAVIHHPMMLVYLDQHVSFGPNSTIAARTGRGLNENLARELLELHTMGVGSGYSQADVRQAAELLTGLTVRPGEGFLFRPRGAEPGAETILGVSYGGDRAARLDDIDAFLGDLATRPETARHITRKLAVHFLADDPPEALLADLVATWTATDGDLGAVTRTLLTHPTTATAPLAKVRPPMEFIAAALGALGADGSAIARLSRRDLGRAIVQPLVAMGQPFMRPGGPDGWSEEAAHWITPQGLATRISWAVAVAERLGGGAGDPRDFLDRTLGPVAGEALQFAVSAAETRAEGVAMTLASAEFNRR